MKRVLLALVSALVVSGLTGFAGSAAASRPSTSPGTGLAAACNMLLDPTMFTGPMANDAAQGNAGMFRAVGVSTSGVGC